MNIRVASLYLRSARRLGPFEAVSSFVFPKKVNQRIKKGENHFLLAALEGPETANEWAGKIADLKMKRPDADFHFIGQTV